MSKPIHLAFIEGAPLRFFASPADRQGEPPWVVFKDLHRAMQQPAADLDRCFNLLQMLPAGDARALIATEDGMEMIVSYTVAYGFNAGLISEGHAKLSLAHAFGEAVGGAIDALLNGLSPDERLARKQAWLSVALFEGPEFGTA